LGWLVVTAYLLASMTPSLAITVPVDLSMQCEDEVAAGHEHGHANGELAAHSHSHSHSHSHPQAHPHSHPHSHDAAKAADCGHDRDKPGRRHAVCCGSVLCFSAISPQAPSLTQRAAPRSRCESVPDLMGDDGTYSQRYRPPIA
jgi:hypothetical protein